MKLRAYLFEWPSRHSVHLALSLMIGVSLVLHVAGLAAFQISYPHVKLQPVRSAEVFFVRPGTPEAAGLASFITAADPALFSPGETLEKGMGKLPDTAYQPSFAQGDAPLFPLPAAPAPTALPLVASSDPISITPYRPKEVSAPAPGLPTSVKLGGALASRTITPPKRVVFSAHGSKALAPAEFLISVAPDGRVLHVFPFPQWTSGNETLDHDAVRYLLQARLSATDGPEPVWGTAVFLWGDDVDRDREKTP